MELLLRHVLIGAFLSLHPMLTGAADVRTQVFVAFGDSTTAPREVEGRPLRVYATVLQTTLAGEGVIPRVINRGVPGNTTTLARKRFVSDVLAKKPDTVLIQFGINDAAVDVWKDPPAKRPRVPLSQYRKNLIYFVDELTKREIQVVLIAESLSLDSPAEKELYGKPPYDPTDPDGWDVVLKEYVGEVRRIAFTKQIPLVDVDAAFREFGKDDGRTVDDLLLDGMHPNAKGHRLIAKLIFERLNDPRPPRHAPKE